MRWISVCAAAAALAANAWAADVSGFIDLSYSQNLNDPPGVLAPDTPLRLYDENVNTWLLNAAHLEIAGGFSDAADYVVEINVGIDALYNVGWYVDLQEAYINARSADSGFGVRAGKFATFAGIEVIESPDNPTFSRGLIYSYGVPLTHTGALLTYAEGDLDFAIGFVNGWDRWVNNDDEQTVIAKVGVAAQSDLNVTFTYMRGPEDPAGDLDRTLIDLVLAMDTDAGATFYFEYLSGREETAGADDEWSGIGLQMVMEGSEGFSLGFRYESFDDADGTRLAGVPGGGGEASNFTIAPAFRISDSTTLRLELRMDNADWNAFTDDQGNPTDKQTTFGLEIFSRF